MISEKDLERKFCHEAEKRGAMTLKFVSPGVSGVPDRICLAIGEHIFFAEIKKPGVKPRPLQLHVFRKIQKLGFRIWIIDSEASIQRCMEQEFSEGG